MRFIARQPIFDLHQRVYGYELLFRKGPENSANISDCEQAGRITLDNSLLWGLDQLSDGKLAFVNCTRAMLMNGLVELLPSNRTVLEVLETISGDPEVVEACRRLRAKRYVIALDDVTSFEEVSPYLGIATVVKVDWRLTSEAEHYDLAKQLRRHRVRELAEKVESQEEYREAVDCGFELFQGFYFQRPEVMRTRDVPVLQTNSFRLLQAVGAPSLDLAFVEEAIREEPSLCFRLLRYLNSPLFTFDFEITSVGHAVRLLGEQETRRWLLVSVAAALAERKSPDLAAWALTRARFCELNSLQKTGHGETAFLLGLLSTFPALLEISTDQLVNHLPVALEIKNGLLGVAGYQNSLLRLMLAYEAGAWTEVGEVAREIGLSQASLESNYLAAVQWSNEIAHPRQREFALSAAVH